MRSPSTHLRGSIKGSIRWAGIILFCAIGMVREGAAQLNTTSDAYTHKARNLQPEDFGVDERSWESALRWCNDRLGKNPDDLNARLIRAIAYREFGVRRALLLRARDWRRSEDDFEAILEQDSLFKDVLYQYATLYRYRGDLEEALGLLHREVAANPALPHAVLSLFRTYQQMLHEKNAEDVSAWLEAHPSSYATFFEAELLRRAGSYREADSVLTRLLKNRGGIPYQPIFLARARIYYALKRPRIAQSFVRQAIQAIHNVVEARFVLEDFKYILSDEEIERYFTISDPKAYSSFFNEVLASRNPIRSQEIDERMQEHYRRMLVAERRYAYYASREAYRVMNNVRMDRMADNDFPAAYWLNGELGDKGLIYVRHGDPQDIARSVSEGTPYIESWRYLDPDLDFHFEGMSGLSELIPTLPLSLDVLDAREIWGGTYARLAMAIRQRDGQLGVDRSTMNQMDLMVFNNQLFDESREDVHDGLTSDRHQWPRGTHHLEVQQFLASFRGPDEKTAVEIHYAIPLGLVSRSLESDRERLRLTIGVAVDDTTWHRVESSLVERQVPTSDEASVAAVDFARFVVLPDSYHVSFHVRVDETDWIGSYEFDYRVADYTSNMLSISDLLPAVKVEPTTADGPFVRNGLYIQANPGRGFRTDRPVHVYFEVYNLTFGDDDRTSYEIRYTLQKPDADQRKFRLFRRSKDPVLSLTFERGATERTAIEFGAIDMQSVDPGVYELMVTVTDKNTGASVSTSQVIELQDR